MKINAKIIIINGANLNLIGVREKNIYGSQSFDKYFSLLKKKFSGIRIEYFQSNHEGDIINKIHECGFDYDGIILNAGAWSHSSIAIADAVSAVKTPVVEVHISNVHSRESFRHVSVIAGNCRGLISGFGLDSYTLALQSFLE
jgi:3-dehydroquinate dehydratase II